MEFLLSELNHYYTFAYGTYILIVWNLQILTGYSRNPGKLKHNIRPTNFIFEYSFKSVFDAFD